MKRKVLELVIVVNVLALISIVTVGKTKKEEPKPVVKVVCRKVPMGVLELQEFLNRESIRLGIDRYKCVVDGEMGNETLGAWENWTNDQYAGVYFEKEPLQKGGD